MSLLNKRIKFTVEPKLLKLLLSTGLWCVLDYSNFAYFANAQVPIKLPSENRPNLRPIPTQDIPSSTFNLDNPPPLPESVSPFDPIRYPQLNVYRLDTGDGINVSVPRYPEFNAVGVLDAEGNLIVPILGRISLSGLTLSEVEAKIAYELGNRFLRETPEVLASLTLTRPAQISILGEVVRPGFYGLVAGSPITDVLQAAGGSTDEADLRSITIRRTLRDGTIIEQNVNLYSTLVEGEQLPPVFLQGGDTIIVSQLQPGENENYDRYLVAKSTLPQQTITIRVVFPSSTGTSLRNLVLPNGSTFIDAVASLPEGDPLLTKQDIALFRFDSDRGTIVTQSLDTKEVIQVNSTQNIPLEDEDVIVVSRTLLGKVFNAFDTISRPVRNVFSFRSFFNFLLD